jgi:hypothetical protein
MARPRIRDITPSHLRCSLGACPAIYASEDGNLVIVGKKPSKEVLQQLEGKVGEDEFVVTISPELIGGLGQAQDG